METKNKINPLPDATAGTVRDEVRELETIKVDGIKWRKWHRDYKLQPGELVSIHQKIGKVVTGGK